MDTELAHDGATRQKHQDPPSAQPDEPAVLLANRFDPILCDLAQSYLRRDAPPSLLARTFEASEGGVTAEIVHLDQEREKVRALSSLPRRSNRAIRRTLGIVLVGSGSAQPPVHMFFRIADLFGSSASSLEPSSSRSTATACWANVRVIDRGRTLAADGARFACTIRLPNGSTAMLSTPRAGPDIDVEWVGIAYGRGADMS